MWQAYLVGVCWVNLRARPWTMVSLCHPAKLFSSPAACTLYFSFATCGICLGIQCSHLYLQACSVRANRLAAIKRHPALAGVGSVGWRAVLWPKGCGFNFWSGHMPVRVRTRGNQLMFLSHWCFSLSLPPPLSKSSGKKCPGVRIKKRERETSDMDWVCCG